MLSTLRKCMHVLHADSHSCTKNKFTIYCTVYPVLLFKPWILDLNKRLKPMSIDSTYFDSFDISFSECRIQDMYSVHVTSL